MPGDRFSHPDVQTVIELGGQNAKIILFADAGAGRRKKLPSMNDKCAGGTGAVIDKIAAKVGVAPADVRHQTYDGIRIHPVAGKCGVFAETDITGLLKQGIPARELMASLFDAIVLQNLSVLTRGSTLRPRVLLLGGPNAFITGLREAWRLRIGEMWRDRGVRLPERVTPAELVAAPPFAEYYAALGAIEFGRLESPDVGRYVGPRGTPRTSCTTCWAPTSLLQRPWRTRSPPSANIATRTSSSMSAGRTSSSSS